MSQVKNVCNISIVIPCYPPDIESLFINSISSLEHSTIFPYEVIIALSETDESQAQELEQRIKKTTRLNISILATTEKQYAGENRNRGALAAKSDTIMFFDADDEAHPQKIEITKIIFDLYKPKMMTHHFLWASRKFEQYDTNCLNIIKPETIYEYTLGKKSDSQWIFSDRYATDKWGGNEVHPHHGHVAIDKSVILQVQYSADPRGQDAKFCVDVLKTFKNTIDIKANLVNYIMYPEKPVAKAVIRWWEPGFKIEVKQVINTDKKKRAILVLDSMPKEAYDNYAKLTSQFSKSEPNEVWSVYPVMGKKYTANDQLIRKSSIIEPFFVYNYLRKKNIPYRIWYNNALFIYNDSLFRITNSSVYEEDLDKLYLSCLRETWGHPFFGFLEVLISRAGGKVAKPNPRTMYNAGCMNKLYALKELYSRRADFIGDFAIPYNLNRAQYEIFLTFLKERMGNELVIKVDCVQEGKGVTFKSLEKSLYLPQLTKLLDKHKRKSSEIFIAPALKIKKEYRCYFSKGDENKIYSIKQRVNKGNTEDYFKHDNIQIYKNIEVKWLEVDDQSEEFEKASNIAKEMIPLMTYTSGSLEFAITEEDKIVFFEVNQMAGPLPFVGKDLDNMNDYYSAIFDQMFEG
ncbi:MAG: glycosyltransferase family A protein [Pseudomonadota bacterium]